jgi:hypothetical protein
MKMKTKFFLVLAAVALLFTACKKDDEKEQNNETPEIVENELENNTLVYDGTTYQLNPMLEIYNPSLAMLHGINDEIQFMYYHIHHDNEDEMYDKTFSDLTKEWPFFMIEGLFNMDTEAGTLGDHDYETVFTSGTAKHTLSNNTYTFVLDGTLQNGKDFAVKLVVTNDWFAER